MARASVKTRLTLERWAEIFGLDALHFNQLHSAVLEQRDTCGDIWYQHAWQDANRVGREDIARAIQAAEERIENFLGYTLLPVYHLDEEKRPERPAVPERISTGYNIRGMAKSIRANRAYIIQGGREVKEVYQTSAVITRSDDDGDGYKETATISVAQLDDPCELHVYFPGVDGDDAWEVRPVEAVDMGATIALVFKSWQIVKPASQESHKPGVINADDDANYLTTVDVYRIYTDRSQQVEFLWENPENSCGCGDSECTECMLGAQNGCLVVRDDRIGRFAYKPGAWDSASQKFQFSQFLIPRDPDRMRISYLAGWQKKDSPCPTTQLDPYWEKVVAYYAASLLDRNICACNNASTFVQNWRDDLNRQDEVKSFQLSERQITNPFGATRGGLFAWNSCTAPGRRVGTQ